MLGTIEKMNNVLPIIGLVSIYVVGVLATWFLILYLDKRGWWFYEKYETAFIGAVWPLMILFSPVIIILTLVLIASSKVLDFFEKWVDKIVDGN